MMQDKKFYILSHTVFDNAHIFYGDGSYATGDDESYRISEACEKLNELNDENKKLKDEQERLFQYFSQWFEEERGIYYDEFIELWNSIKNSENSEK